jgi:hypothetical protein
MSCHAILLCLFSNSYLQILASARAQPGALTGGLNWYRAILFSLALLPAYRKVHVCVDCAFQCALTKFGFVFQPMSVPTLVLFGTKDHALEIGMMQALKPKFVPNMEVTWISASNNAKFCVCFV